VAFFERFQELTRGVTSILISHRFSSVRRADHIVVIEGGRVSEQGSHAQLMKSKGHYAQLFTLQADRFARGLSAEGDIIEDEVDIDATVDLMEDGE
jgi:ATP-binding cassette subfamily B protein